MKVSHIDTLNTHAIIGGTNIQQMSASLDAEFFEILSSTLYSQKKLAVVREVMCNAHDANLEVGKEDKFIEVTLSNSELKIKDLGPGIAKEKIIQIYGTYGGSTKRKNEKVTGGFGLGSKAPFAYAKNFAVTSCHGGWKTVFNISRGTEATNGIPDIRTMVSVPSTETGLTVSIPINSADMEEFSALVKTITFFGGMKVKLNGMTLQHMDYAKADADMPFVLVPKGKFPPHLSLNNQRTDYYVKVGAVVYNIPSSFMDGKTIGSAWGAGGLNLLNDTRCNMIFLAPPNSIGIVPSREAIELTEKTQETLRMLIASTDNYFNDSKPELVNLLVKEFKQKTEDFIDNRNVGESALSAIMDNPEKGYQIFAKRQLEILSSHSQWTTSVVKDRETFVPFLRRMLLEHHLGHNECASVLLKEDPEGKQIFAATRNIVKERFPILQEDLFNMMLKKGRSYNSSYRIAKYRVAIALKKLLTNIEENGGSTVAMIGRYNSKKLVISDWQNMVRRTKNRPTQIGFTSNQQEFLDFLIQYRYKSVREIPFVLASSDAAFQRLRKGVNEPDMTLPAFGVIIYARNKKVYAELKKHLQDVLKLTKVWFTDDPKFLPKPPEKKYPANFTIMSPYHKGKRDAVVRLPKEGEKVTHYMYAPMSAYVGNTGIWLEKKISISKEDMEMISYLYPNLAIVETVHQASTFEASGVKNIFYDIAEEAGQWISHPDNYEQILPYLGTISQFSLSYNFSTVAAFVPVPMILEALDRKPKYPPKDKPIPTVVSLFLSLLSHRLAPKYGFQLISRKGHELTQIIGADFSDDLVKVLRHPMMVRFIKHLPSVHTTSKDEQIAFRAALLSVIQTVRVYTKLEGM